MRLFATLFQALDETNKTSAKLAALVAYFRVAPPEDAAWVLALLSGHKRRRYLGAGQLRAWAAGAAGVPDWLFGESYDAVGDLGETISLLLALPTEPQSEVPLHVWMQHIQGLKTLPESEQRAYLVEAWTTLSRTECFLLNKLVGGSFRVGVSTQLVVRALASVTGTPEATLAHRLMGTWEPTGAVYTCLFDTETTTDDVRKPYPFYLAYPLEQGAAQLGDVAAWQAEWKWDGIRAQLLHRQGEVALWSRGEELLTERFPELAEAAAHLPQGTVLDGEVLPWLGGAPLPFGELQRRIGRKNLTKKILAEVPVVLVAYDLLEAGGADIRTLPLSQRRAQLEALIAALPAGLPIQLSPTVPATSWDELAQLQAQARAHLAEGLMLKALASGYGVGRRRGDWWKWKTAPLSVDAVLVYAQRGSGKRASLYTDYTFAVWDGPPPPPGTPPEAAPPRTLVPFAKAYSGLSDAEIARVDAFIRRNTQERFGPVRTVAPVLVFEIGFEGIQASPRHKSGVAVRFPRILRWREDKPAEEADTLEGLKGV